MVLIKASYLLSKPCLTGSFSHQTVEMMSFWSLNESFHLIR